MVCPMKNTPTRRMEVPTEYPFQSLYRPWSWIFSSMFNIFLFAVLLGFIYVYHKSRRSGKKKRIVNYRTIQVTQGESERRKKKTALVTGGNGVFGEEVITALIKDGRYVVHSLDSVLPEDEDREEGVSTYIQADITDPDDMRVAFKDVDVVFHCSSLTPVSIRYSDDDYHRVNVVGTENVINACSKCGVKRLIYTSNACVNLSRSPKEASNDSDESCPLPDNPLNVYVATVGKADQLVQEANGKEGLVTCVLRPDIYVQGLLSGMVDFLYYPTGLEFEVSLVSIESAVQAHLLADKKLSNSPSAAAGKAYNITEAKVTVHDFAKFVAAEKKTSLTYVPMSVVKFLTWINVAVYKWTGLVVISESLTAMTVQYKSHTYTSKRAQQELGWSSSTSWKDLVRKLLKSLADENKKDN